MEYINLSRLKYLQLQTEQIFEPIFETVGVIGVMDSLFCEYTDAMNIGVWNLVSSIWVIDHYQLRRPDEHAGSVAEHVGSFGRSNE